MTLLTVENLYSGYGKVDVLFGISLSISAGKSLGIVGPNGVGKSTLLKTIAGEITPKSGSISLLGETISGRKPEDIVRMGLSLVPEGRQIFSGLSVTENLMLGLTGRKDKASSKVALDQIRELFPVLNSHATHQAGM